jgi:hypothetical protein
MMIKGYGIYDDSVCLIEGKQKDVQETLDLKPEYYHYRDEGCEFVKACLECPFPHCLFDEPRGIQRLKKRIRNENIKRLFNTGKKTRELALFFGLSQRTIKRALKAD